MAKKKKSVDKVRASRDGHEFHEAWTARKSMQLLMPDGDLKAIAVEGLSPVEQKSAAAHTIDIADLTFYYNGRPTFQDAARVTIAQFKYSIADEGNDFRASHAKKTIEKFAQTFTDYSKRFGADEVNKKLSFQIFTNQPVCQPLYEAVDGVARGATLSGKAEKQAEQFKAASGISGKALAAFAAKLEIVGITGSLSAINADLEGLVVDWSASTNDPIAEAHLGRLRKLVRDKAGSKGAGENLITRTDILGVLNIDDEENLVPCKTALINVGKVLPREQLTGTVALVPVLTKPLMIHASGGVGKTVFMDSLAKASQKYCEVVFFDCFGLGAYRAPEDARHLPKKGLIHIANTLAFRGLCEPIIPGAPDTDSLVRTFRRRMEQCVNAISRITPGRKLALFIDAIDNAQIVADQRSEEAFPVLLLNSLHQNPVEGVKLIVSCRTERKPPTFAECEELELRPFTLPETASYLRARMKPISEAQIQVAQSRSGGNGRILEYLAETGPELLAQSEIDKKLELESLLHRRIDKALSSAIERGYEQKDINAFLAGLAVLPPPVPIDEYAAAHGMEPSVIQSFAADLYPLLERTYQGITFRDEPTETLVRNEYSASKDLLKLVADNLFARQESSVYAATALPGLLHELDDGERLFDLALDPRIPSQITSTVGKRNVRYARLKAATLHAAIKNDYNKLVNLLVELSSIAAVDQRGVDYILSNPDLVVAAQDVDATRRLFETRTAWPGTRHARLTIAHCLRGDATEAYRHAVSADEWLRHYSRIRDDNRPDRAGPKQLDVAAIALLLIAEKRPADAQAFLRWPDLYMYEVCEHIFRLLDLGVSLGSWPVARRSASVKELDAIGTLAAALSFQSLSKPSAQELCLRLAKRCRRATKLKFRDRISRNRTHQLEDGLRKSAAIALSLGLKKEALGISLRAPHGRAGLWSFRDSFSSQDIFGMLFRVALVSAATGQPIHEKDLLPRELKPVCARIKKNLTGAAFREEAKKQVAKVTRSYREDEAPEGQKKGLSRDEGEKANAFFDRRLESLLLLTRALAAFLATPKGGGNREFVALIKAWESARKSRDPYRTQQLDDLFRNLGLEAALFALWARPALSPASVQRVLECLHAQDPHAPVLIRVVAILSRQKAHQSVAGQESIKARALIDQEDDVTYKGSLYSDLGRAILPASVDEASANFRDGLEHMDAIGSGDYRFTNELLLFASSIKGDELDEQGFHTLTNINELNMGEETHKFYWRAYGSGMSKTSGIRGLAKLSRWDDRSKVELTYTLLPYLTALVEDGKIEPRDALILNRLAKPAEYFEAGTKLLAEVVDAAAKDDRPALLNELIGQYLDDNPGTPWDTTLEALAKLAEAAFGDSELTQYLRAAGKRYGTVRNTRNERMNYRSGSDAWLTKRSDDTDKKNNEALKKIIGETDPLDELSLTKAVEGLNALERFYAKREQFFDPLREKIPYAKRSEYVKLIASLENLDFYPKLNELEKCHEVWAASSAALKAVYKEEAIPLVRRHADELIGDDSLSGYKLKQVSDLCGVAIADLVLELIKALARPDAFVSGAVWLAFGTFVCPRAEPGQGQEALKRLLASDAATFADKVTDGPWKKGFYPDNNIVDVVSGLIWRMLGSPSANDRWRAAHSVRACARLGRWPFIDALVARLNDESLGPFNATELPFYYLHARLWLLIALARIAKDYPKEIAAYKSGLLPFATEKSDPHVLTRHFAAQALLTCVDAGELKLASNTVTELRNADSSPFPVVPKPAGGVAGYYAGRPKGSPPPPYKFGIDYDFHKHDVDWLGRLFFKPTWQVADDIADLANKIDPKVEDMYEDGGRERPGRRTSYGMTMRYHTYGEQIGWHAFLRTAGRLLTTVPVTKDQWEDDPWREWLRRYSLTHPEGWWLSDGTDRKPLDTAVFLLRRDKEKLVLTGDKQELLALARLGERVKNELVVEGDWYSADGVAVAVSSALVPPSKAATFARSVLREDPMIAWLPSLFASEEDDEYERSEKKEYTPWTVLLYTSAKLDEYDPYGVPQAASRPRLGSDFLSSCSLVTDDSFARFWHDKRGKVQLRAEVWGRKDDDREDGPHPGTRLLCSASSLKKVLKKFDKELLVLIRLRRYEKEGYRSESKYTHTVAVARINQSLDVEYFKGRVNHLHKAKY